MAVYWHLSGNVLKGKIGLGTAMVSLCEVLISLTLALSFYVDKPQSL